MFETHTLLKREREKCINIEILQEWTEQQAEQAKGNK